MDTKLVYIHCVEMYCKGPLNVFVFKKMKIKAIHL